jgi:hypothetical protein
MNEEEDSDMEVEETTEETEDKKTTIVLVPRTKHSHGVRGDKQRAFR